MSTSLVYDLINGDEPIFNNNMGKSEKRISIAHNLHTPQQEGHIM